jgi:hypothetical protein
LKIKKAPEHLQGKCTKISISYQATKNLQTDPEKQKQTQKPNTTCSFSIIEKYQKKNPVFIEKN